LLNKDSPKYRCNICLEPNVQGGDFCDASGFPTCGHAHQHQRKIAEVLLIGSGTVVLASIPGNTNIIAQRGMIAVGFINGLIESAQ
tara:strand:+ start:664 stop:921 length:258 start_codon:yes stop_codon:yes gene_type:complete